MIRSFADKGTQDLYEGRDTKAARKICPVELTGLARTKLRAVHVAENLQDLRTPPGNKLHPLKDDRKGQHAIRINDGLRICLRWTKEGPEDVEITQYH